jgi:hypothetical protein
LGKNSKNGAFDEQTQETEEADVQHELAQADGFDSVIEFYTKDVDRTLLRENLKLTVEERFIKFEQFWKYAQELREAGRKARQSGAGHGANFRSMKNISRGHPPEPDRFPPIHGRPRVIIVCKKIRAIPRFPR